MTYSVGVEYALHCLIYLIDPPKGKAMGIKELAAYQGVSETYLSKFFTKLKKAAIVDSVPGVNGGYRLLRSPEQITFWDVVEAIEGSEPIFQCGEIRQKEAVLDPNNLPKSHCEKPCTIKVVMWEAEEQMRQYLRQKTLQWLYEEVSAKVTDDYRTASKAWFDQK